MRNIYLLLGANIGDRESALRKAVDLLGESSVAVIDSSPIFETAAWGKEDQPSFLNQAIEIESDLSAENLMERILEVEEKMGRVRQDKYGARIIDIDIIFFSDRVINQLNLSVPHPRMQKRRFVLAPLNEIASDFTHPIFNKTVKELLLDCEDPLTVTRFTPLNHDTV